MTTVAYFSTSTVTAERTAGAVTPPAIESPTRIDRIAIAQLGTHTCPRKMASPTSPVEQKLPQRSGTVTSTVTNTTAGRASISDDEAIPDSDSSQVCRALEFGR